jgi:small subunit ribosomal protein S11
MSEEKTPPTPAATTGEAPAAPAPEKKPRAPKEKPAAPAEGKANAPAAEGKDAPAATGEAVTGKDLLTEDAGAVKVRRAKGSKNISQGICHSLATFNITKVTFSDTQGNVISWSSSGKCNFHGSRKSTAYAAQVVTQDAGRAAMAHGLKEIAVKVRGPGLGRDSAIRALQTLGLSVSSIMDVTPVPHNGCRPRKRRRV